MFIPSNQKLWLEIGKDQLLQKPRFWAPLIGIIAVTFFTQEKLLLNFNLIETFIVNASVFIPSINKWAERSFMPMQTRFLFILCWIALPYYTLLLANYRPYELNFKRKWLSAGKVRHLYPLLLLISTIGSCFFFYFFALPEDSSCRRICIHESLLVQLIFAFSYLIMLASLLAANVWWVRNYKEIHFQ